MNFFSRQSGLSAVAASRPGAAHSAWVVSNDGDRPGRRYALLRAFSLVEILIVTALVAVIVLGLMAMFGQTQRAFRLGLAQTDVLEAGRAATELLAREVELVQPSGQSAVTNFHASIPAVSPLLQELPGMPAGVNDPKRTNFHMDLFFLTRENQRWTAMGYTIRDPQNVTVRPLGGVGTLYRYTVDNLSPGDLGSQADLFLRSNEANFNRIADGVVHFRVRAFDPDGLWITEELTNNFNFHKSDVRWSTLVPGEIGLCVLKSNAVPAAVEIELGFLESRVLERANSIPNNATRREFIERQAGRVHLFRQRIPIHSVDIQAYQ